jgi:hypothetical protein
VNNHLRDAIQQADLLIKEGKIKSARKVLLPYQNDPMARKRLVWLEKKQQQALRAGKKRNAKSNSRRRYPLYLFMALITILGLSILAIYRLSLPETVPPTVAGEATSIISDSTARVSAGPSATEIPPTEDSQEVGLQEQLRDWFMTVDGVNNVLSLDVDVLSDGPPLVYAEIGVNPGYNDTRIPDIFMQKLNDSLNTTRYSDFVIIINDELRVVEYAFDSENIVWQQTELASTTPSTPDSS